MVGGVDGREVREGAVLPVGLTVDVDGGRAEIDGRVEGEQGEEGGEVMRRDTIKRRMDGETRGDSG